MSTTTTTTRMALTYANLRALLDSGQRTLPPAANEGEAAELVPGHVTIHDHPHSGRPLEIHFMVDGQKIAEFGPPEGTEGVDTDVAPGYIDFLGQWMGQPVHHVDWKNLIMADNDMTPHDRTGIDSLAFEVRDLVAKARNRRGGTHVTAAGGSMVFDASDLGALVRVSGELADAVIAAHTIHDSYSIALDVLEGRDR